MQFTRYFRADYCKIYFNTAPDCTAFIIKKVGNTELKDILKQ